jgi:hypothetical protein
MIINIDRVVQERDVDAALYLLTRILGCSEGMMDLQLRNKLAKLQKKVSESRNLSDSEKSAIVGAYHEVIG